MTLANVLLAIVALGVITQATAPELRFWLASPLISQTATHMDRVRVAADRYVRDNYASLAASAPINGASIGVSLQQLRDGGYLPAAATDTNPYGQNYVIRIRHVIQGTGANQRQVLEPMVLTIGGRAIPEKELRRAAGQISAGGFISQQSPTVAKGVQGGWGDIQLASFGVSPGAGHLAVAMFYDHAGATSEYLYRNAVAGRPEVNRMNTNIDMNMQNLANAASVTAQQATVSGDATVQGTLVLSAKDGSRYGGWTMVDNTWVRSVDDKGIYTGGTMLAGAMQATTVTGTNISGSTVNATAVSGSSVTGTNVIANGRMYANEYMQVAGQASPGTSCPSNGLVGRTQEGGLLSCESGVWRAPGGGLAQYPGPTCPAGMNLFGIYTSYRYRWGPIQEGWLTNTDMVSMYESCSGGGDGGTNCQILPNYTQFTNSPSVVKCG